MSADSNEYGLDVEPEGFPVGEVLAVALVIFGTIAIAVGVLFQIFNKGVQTADFEAAVEYVAYPEIQSANSEATRKLSQFEVIDDSAGVYRIPIDSAIDLLIQERGASVGARTNEIPAGQ